MQPQQDLSMSVQDASTVCTSSGRDLKDSTTRHLHWYVGAIWTVLSSLKLRLYSSWLRLSQVGT